MSYIERSKFNLLLNIDSSKPNSVDSIFSGLRSGFNLVLGAPKVVSPK